MVFKLSLDNNTIMFNHLLSIMYRTDNTKEDLKFEFRKIENDSVIGWIKHNITCASMCMRPLAFNSMENEKLSEIIFHCKIETHRSRNVFLYWFYSQYSCVFG